MNPTSSNNKIYIIVVSIIIVAILAFAAYWYFLLYTPAHNGTGTDNNGTPTGFQPINRPSNNNGQTNNGNNGNNNTSGTSTPIVPGKIPTLRLLSNTPVGGYGAATTASTTVVRWVDRGRGNIYEAKENTLDVTTLSNTIVPMMYQSGWNKNLTAFIGSMLQDGSGLVSTVYASLVPQATTTATTTAGALPKTPFTLKGKNMPETIVSYAVSPKKDRVFLFSIESGRGIGYIAPFNGGTAAEIFDTPVTQVNVDWPEENIIAISTKGSAGQSGFLYFVNPQTGVWKKVVGPLPGLSTKVSHDGKFVIVSGTGSNKNVATVIYDVVKGNSTDAVVNTLADKCAWGNFYMDMVYCGVPAQSVSATYPDDWYTGKISTVDKIWQINADTGEVHLVSSITDQSDRVIDAFNLGLDPKDDYLFFMNKNDLSLWSLDLVSSQ